MCQHIRWGKCNSQHRWRDGQSHYLRRSPVGCSQFCKTHRDAYFDTGVTDRRKRERARAGIEPTAAAPSQPGSSFSLSSTSIFSSLSSTTISSTHHRFLFWERKEVRQRKRTKEEEIERGNCGPPTRKVFRMVRWWPVSDSANTSDSRLRRDQVPLGSSPTKSQKKKKKKNYHCQASVFIPGVRQKCLPTSDRRADPVATP